MKLVTIILNKTECLDELLEEFTQNKISGATIIDSKGMVQELYDHDHEDLFFLVSLRSLLEPTHKENKTIIMVAKEEPSCILWLPILRFLSSNQRYL